MIAVGRSTIRQTLTLTRSVVQGNTAGNGGAGGGAGTPGNGGMCTSVSGGSSGFSCATDGGAGGAGGGIALEPGSSVITDSTIRNNSSGAGGAGAAAATGGTGGTGTTVQGHGGDSEAGEGGSSGDYAGAELRSTAGNTQFVASTAIFGNTTPDGGSGGAGGTGGAGSPAGDSFGGGGGNGGNTAGLGVLGTTDADRWVPGIGDPTFIGWFTVVAYFWAMIFAGLNAWEEKRASTGRPRASHMFPSTIPKRSARPRPPARTPRSAGFA